MPAEMESSSKVRLHIRRALEKAFLWALQTSVGSSVSSPARALATSVAPIECGSHSSNQPTRARAEVPARSAKMTFRKTNSGEAPGGTVAASKTGRRREGSQPPELWSASMSRNATLRRAPAKQPGRDTSPMYRIAFSISPRPGTLNRLFKVVLSLLGRAPPCRLQKRQWRSERSALSREPHPGYWQHRPSVRTLLICGFPLRMWGP